MSARPRTRCHCGRFHLGVTRSCAQCLERFRLYRHHTSVSIRRKSREQAEARRTAPGPNRIAHCGAWHPLTTLPWCCPQCGAVVGQAEGTA